MPVTAPNTLLTSITDAFELSKTEAGRLFGVSRQAIAEWERSGIPSGRKAKAATIAAIGDLLTHRLKRERIAGIARRPALAYGGLSMLEMIEDDRHDELLDLTRQSFDWARAA